MIITFALVMWVIQIFVILGLLVAIVLTRHTVQASWISVSFSILLILLLVRRIDDIGLWAGYDLIPAWLSAILSWIFIGTIAYGKWQVLRRAAVLRGIEAKYQARIDQLEALRAYDEKNRVGSSWDYLKAMPTVYLLKTK